MAATEWGKWNTDAKGWRMRLGETGNPGWREPQGADGGGWERAGLVDPTSGSGMAPEGILNVSRGCAQPHQKARFLAGSRRCTTRVQTISWNGKLQCERIRS